MATTKQTPADRGETLELHEKDVVLTVYGPEADTYEHIEDVNEGSGEGLPSASRAFVSQLFGRATDVDLTKTYTNEKETFELQFNITAEDDFGDASEFHAAIDPFFSGEKEALRNFLEDAELPEWATIIDEVDEETHFSNDPSDPFDELIDNTYAPDVLSKFGFNYDVIRDDFRANREIPDPSIDADEDEMITQYVRVTGPHRAHIKPREVLVHSSERSKENRFEPGPERWSAQVKVHLEATSDDELDEMSQAMVPQLFGELASLPGVHKVRLSDCEKTVCSTGECMVR